eukprot:s256_g21.t1
MILADVQENWTGNQRTSGRVVLQLESNASLVLQQFLLRLSRMFPYTITRHRADRAGLLTEGQPAGAATGTAIKVGQPAPRQRVTAPVTRNRRLSGE